MKALQTGTVKFFNAERDFGFISRPNRADIFFVGRDIIGLMPRNPIKGDQVTFDETRGPRGLQAVNICNRNDPESLAEFDAGVAVGREKDHTEWADTEARLEAHYKAVRARLHIR